MTTTKAVTHRVRQARSVALRAQLALTLTQILLWVSLIGGAAAIALWAWRRIAARPQSASAEPPQTVTSDTAPASLP